MPLSALLADRADVWRGRALPATTPTGPSTGFPALDAALPWRGWPAGGLSEVFTTAPGAGLALLLPLLVSLSRQPRWLVLAAPPLLPFAPALAAQGLDLTRLVLVTEDSRTPWVMEQALRSGACGAVLGWEPAGRDGVTRTRGRHLEQTWSATTLKRLQLAAAAGAAVAVLVRPPPAAAPSPAALRLVVQPAVGALLVELLKVRGGRAGVRVRCPLGQAASPPPGPDEVGLGAGDTPPPER